MGHKGGHWYVHVECIVWTKGTSWAEATSNSEKIKPLALAIIELRLSEGISQSVVQSVENSIKYIFKIP